MNRQVFYSRIFNEEQHMLFSSLSGDTNPIHTDDIYARRTQAGERIVHGMHNLLSCLQGIAKNCSNNLGITGVSAQFVQPVYVGETVNYCIVTRNEKYWLITACTNEVTTAKFKIHLMPRKVGMSLTTNGDPYIPEMSEDLNFKQLNGRSGCVTILDKIDDFAKAFPHASEWIGAQLLCELASLSTIVGMCCPGLHSMLTKVDVGIELNTRSDAVMYKVGATDERFSLVNLCVQGKHIIGTVDAFMRPPPTSQLAYAKLLNNICSEVYADQRALIIGGSRGLGELCAKIISAGGGYPVITYQSGEGDARRVKKEIIDHGGRCEILQYDVLNHPAQQLKNLQLIPTHLYYFATPKIFNRKKKTFLPKLYETFNSYYCVAFSELLDVLGSICSQELKVLYPSTTAINERPDGLTEYVMAKAAGELLCEDLNRFSDKVRIVVSRLPRILTDQTATIGAVESHDAMQVLMPLIQECQ